MVGLCALAFVFFETQLCVCVCVLDSNVYKVGNDFKPCESLLDMKKECGS